MAHDECLESYQDCTQSRQARVLGTRASNPTAPLQKIAELAGVSTTTAKRLLSKKKKSVVSRDTHPELHHRGAGTGNNEWFTPAEYIEAARNVLGEIDLDPASHPLAQEIVKAKQFFTREDNGLNQPWLGRVWLNPPYGKSEIEPFIEKLIDEIELGNTSAILLTHNYTDTAWFHAAALNAQMICFTKGRIRFVDQDGNKCSPTQGQAFFYYGDAASTFADVFRKFGLIVQPL
jgi:phage N-6-adenine-methyltransferase